MAKLVRTPIQQTGSTEFHLFRGSSGRTGKASTQAGKSLRAVGAGHSHKELVVDGDIIADLQALSGVLSVDTDQGTAWVGGGSKIHTLGPALHRFGLALANQGDIDQQSISGATATGTHGTGASLQNLSSRVIGARIALASGEIIECSAEQQRTVAG